MKNFYRLIADSGSTKTQWALISKDGVLSSFRTGGINPFQQCDEEIKLLIKNKLLGNIESEDIDRIHFYGAGCRDERGRAVASLLRELFPAASTVEVASDLLCAARALCGGREGVACILGTGSNSCLYDGCGIVENVSPLGYVLGDEGSGAVLGRRLLGDVLKQQLPAEVCAAFREAYPYTPAEIIERVYRKPLANRFLAGFVPFLSAHRQNEAVHALIVDEFERFFKRNVAAYARPDLSVSFVGSVAYYLREELEAAAGRCGFRVGTVVREPLPLLCGRYIQNRQAG